ncbi:hypothetical protein ACTGZM_11265, partial [Streptococcus suis]
MVGEKPYASKPAACGSLVRKAYGCAPEAIVPRAEGQERYVRGGAFKADLIVEIARRQKRAARFLLLSGHV